MKKLLIVLALVFWASAGFGATYYVDPARPDNNGAGTSWATAEKTINAAVADCAASGDTIYLKNATHILAANVLVNAKSITIKSETEEFGSITHLSESADHNAWTCVITGGSTYYIAVNGGSTVDISGVKFTGFTNTTSGPILVRGQVAGNTALTLSRCCFYNNSSTAGGAVYSYQTLGYYSTLDFSNCLFRGNNAVSSGGAISVLNRAYVTLSNCNFYDNHCIGSGETIATSGGAYHQMDDQSDGETSTVTATNCIFDGNSVPADVDDKIYHNGGQFRVRGESATALISATITACRFLNGSAEYGGGLYFSGHSTGTVSMCLFYGNSASRDGGGLYRGGLLYPAYVNNCIFAENTAGVTSGRGGEGGGAFSLGDSGGIHAKNCTFLNNSAEGEGWSLYARAIQNDGVKCTIYNSIFSGITSGGLYHVIGNNNIGISIVRNCAIASGEFSDSGAVVADMVITSDPKINTNYTLQKTSPCINAGVDVGLLTDFEGNPIKGPPDIGAYEFQLGGIMGIR